MAKTFTAPFAQTPRTATAVTTAACVIGVADAPTSTVKLMTAGTDGAIVTNLSAIPRATVTASSLVLFLSNDGGTTKRLIDSELMGAQTVNTTTAINEVQFARYSEATPLRLAANDELYVGSQVALAAGIVFKAEWMDY
jgi:hypothetical protein